MLGPVKWPDLPGADFAWRLPRAARRRFSDPVNEPPFDVAWRAARRRFSDQVKLGHRFRDFASGEFSADLAWRLPGAAQRRTFDPVNEPPFDVAWRLPRAARRRFSDPVKLGLVASLGEKHAQHR